MPSETNDPQPVLRETHNSHITAKEKMENLKNPVSSTFKSQDITDLAGKLENLAQNTPLRFSDEAMRPPTKSNPRFGNLSHHSFFSRHNPHPHRVTHIQGLNGIPICIVNDEWNVTSPLYPHPMIRSKLPTNLLGVPCLPIGDTHGNMVPFLGAGSMSEAWRDELRELAAKVCTTDKQPEKQEVEEPRRSTQYSAETGRIIPASARALTRQASRKANRTSKGRNTNTHFQDQELLILELLCQILQTDSLSAIQQWLLSAGQREKDLVMNMIQTATANMQHESMGERLTSQNIGLLSKDEYLQRKHLNSRSNDRQKPEPVPEEDKPEHIGTAEVLQIHAEDGENQCKPGSENEHAIERTFS